MVDEAQVSEYERLPIFDPDLLRPKHDEILLWLDENVEQIINQAVYPGLTADQIEEYSSHTPELTKTWQQAVKTAEDEIVGFIDMTVRYEREGDPDDDIIKVFFFDVRTEILSLGALLREINLYKEYLGFQRSWIYTYILVSPDERFVQILKDQEVDFLKFEPSDKEVGDEK